MTPRENELLERLREATLALRKTRTERDTLALEKIEPIAVVGMGCRFPGGAAGPEAFWALLDAGRDAVQPLEERWALVGASPSDEVPRWAGLLREAVEGFDAGFFGISPREAQALDPQHRLLLEVAWEGLEDAGIPARSLDGSRTGVFIGACSTDYLHTISRQPRAERDAYSTTGNMLSVAAGRLSHALGLGGPCLTVDTACSSSLVAMHLACQSLRARESDLALAGGVNVILSVDIMEGLARTQALSPDGRCRVFDAAANGFVRGEGCGVVVLKRLSDAERAGDRIWAVIRGSAVNQDGRATGLTVPNVLAQEALLREALASARVEAGAIGYVETHGTGTPLGDPIEVEALRAVVGAARADGTRCVLGAVKTNVGHLEGAAGVAGLIKAALALHYERIPRNLNFRTLNPRIRLEGSALAVATEAVAWPRSSRPRFAGVSSFGLSGTNAHVVLGEAPVGGLAPGVPERGAELLVLSAKSAKALTLGAARLREHLDAHAGLGLGDVAFSLATTRSAMEHRLAVVAGSREGVRVALAATEGQTGPGVVRGRSAESRGKIAFLFTGQGAQVPGMGRGLCDAWPAFREAFERGVGLFDRELDRPLCDVMWADPGSVEVAQLEQTAFTQPALFALEYALCALWRSWGVEPELVAGHSIGEVCAACVAGVFSLEDAVRLVAARGRLMQALPVGGAMMAIAAAEADVAAAVVPHAGSVAIAGVNGPEQVVIAGAEGTVQAIAAGFARRGVPIQALRVSHAFHSPLMEPMLEAFGRVAESVTYRRASLALVSNVSGKLVTDEMSAPGYWVRHVREAVRFADGVQAMHGAGAGTFIEVGPKPTLLGLVSASLPGAEPTLLPSLRAGRDEALCVLEALGSLWVQGYPVAWERLFPTGGRRVPLPTYPWQRRRHWIEQPAIVPPSAEDPFQEWLYELAWPPTPRPSGPASDVSAQPSSRTVWRWMIFADHAGVGQQLARHLRTHGESCVVIHRGEAFERTVDDECFIRTGKPEDLREVLRAASPLGRPSRLGIVHLWSLDAPDSTDLTVSRLEETHAYTCASVLGLVKELALGWDEPPCVWLVTRGAQAVPAGSGPVSIAQAPLWGLGRVLAVEHPELWKGLIDVDPAASTSAAAACVCAEILHGDGEDQLAFRGANRYAARLVRVKGDGGGQAPATIRADGTYLITGGLGDLGLLVARWMVERGARQLILLGRTPLPPRGEWEVVEPGTRVARQISAIRDLESLGARTQLVAVDVGDEAGLTAVLRELSRTDIPPIRGVVHTAGVVEPKALLELDLDSLHAVLRPKVAGAYLLHQLLADAPLDFFVQFSSASSVLSSPLLGSYAAANAFLDALAHHRRACGQAAVSINWGFWSEIGVGARYERTLGRALPARGMTAISPAQGLKVLDWVFQRDPTQLAVIPLNVDRWCRFHGSARQAPLLTLLVRDGARPATRRGDPSADVVLELKAVGERLRQAPPSERAGALLAYLRDQAARVLGFDSSASLDPRQPLNELGLDSLMAVELRNTLRLALGRNLPVTLLFNYPTLEALAGYLIRDVFGQEAASPVRSGSPHGGDRRSAVVAELERLSEEQVEMLLARKLEAIDDGSAR